MKYLPYRNILHGCAMKFCRAIEPPGKARDDWKIICDVATKMGFAMGYNCASEIMDEIASVSPIYGGISFDRLDSVGLQWPCLDAEGDVC